MGAQESRSQQESDNDGITPQDDYYTILEVDENATADEIRVSFFFTITAIGGIEGDHGLSGFCRVAFPLPMISCPRTSRSKH
jgi:hypothetical protein